MTGSRAKIWAGTSGYSYKEWKGAFYPEDLSPKKFLQYYSEKLSSVEVNNTFYRFPSESMLEGWRDGTPDDFCFSIKAHSRITHKSRLKDVGDFVADFVERCQILGPKLGAILFQLPPNFRRDDERLENFLKILPQGVRLALEFRHESWFEDEVMDQLTAARVALCVSEGEKIESPRRVPGPFCYVRLRKPEYSSEALSDWQQWLEKQAAGTGREVFVYLKHDDKGVSPEHALRILGRA